MCSDLFPNFWLEAEEELADLPFVARQELEEITAHIERNETGEAEAHIDDLTLFSLKTEDYLVQTKIRLEIARVALCMQRQDLAHIAVLRAIRLLDDEEDRRRKAEATLIPIHNHYLAKACLLLAGLEFRNGNQRDVVLANLQRCLDRLVSLSVYHRDHLLTPGNAYKIWANIVRSTISGYVEDERTDPWGAIPVEDGCISSGVWWRSTPPSGTRPATAGPADGPQPAPGASTGSTESPGLPDDPFAPWLFRLQPGSLKNLPVVGQIAVGEYREMPDPLEPPTYASAPGLRDLSSQVSLTDVSRFKIGAHFYRLYDLHRTGGALVLDASREHILLKVVKVDQRYAGTLQPGDYVLVRGQETARQDDLVFYWRRQQNTFSGKLDHRDQSEIRARPYTGRDTGNFEDMPDHEEVKAVTLVKGVVLGVFKRIC